MADLFARSASNFYDELGHDAPVRLAVAHCNFHLRGAESDGDEAFVRGWAASRGLECLVAQFDTAAVALQEGGSIEMAARELRYAWFDKLCRERSFDGVCVAHNANDNAETLILNLLRGTGLDGVCAMSEVSSNPYGSTKVFRPLLQYSRAEIEAYARERGLQWRTDSSNLSSDYKRNRIRNEVFPIFAKINPSFIKTFASDISDFRQARDVVGDYIASVPSPARNEGGVLHIDIAALTSSRHWKFMLFTLLHPYGFNRTALDGIASLLESERITGGRFFFSPSARLVTTTTELVVYPSAVGEASGEGAGETPGGEAGMPRVHIETLAWDAATMDPRTPRGVILLDADSLGSYPVLRRWEEGDWLRPIGLNGRKKVSDMLTDLKYDRIRKEDALVVEFDGSHVAALAGERIDAALRITPSTVRVYRISIS